mgnify:CR=1 FL=1
MNGVKIILKRHSTNKHLDGICDTEEFLVNLFNKIR